VARREEDVKSGEEVDLCIRFGLPVGNMLWVILFTHGNNTCNAGCVSQVTARIKSAYMEAL